jgi:hypothetical protein
MLDKLCSLAQTRLLGKTAHRQKRLESKPPVAQAHHH